MTSSEQRDSGFWALDLICCGRDDGTQVLATGEEADVFRRTYVGASPAEVQGHDRQAIKRRARPDEALGYHECRS